MRRLITFFACWMTACGVMAQLPTPLPYQAKPPTATSSANPSPAGLNTSSSTAGLLNGYVADATYKLRAGDAVSFQILEDRIWNALDLPKSLVVTDSGELDVPYIGRVMAVGKTCQEVASEMKVTLEKDYYNQATVVVSLNSANRLLGRIYIWGQVRNQGALEIQVNENLTAGQAVLRAGGFGDFANKTKVKVVRSTVGDAKDKQTFDLNMEDILEQGKTEKDILLQPGDLIIVPSRLINF